MKNGITTIIVVLFLAVLLGCSNEQPKPGHPVTVKAIPRSIFTVKGSWKNGEFIIGYRIITDEYVIIRDTDGLFGQQQGELGSLVGPGMVDLKKLNEFARVCEIAKKAKDKEPVIFYGHLAYTRDESGPFLFEGKKVIFLFNANYQGQDYEINRRPWG